jgi:hypothetical protein
MSSRFSLIMLVVTVFTASSYADRLQFSGIAKNTDGSISHMTHSGAISYCSSLGMHLPSAMELAQWATEKEATISDKPDTGYYLVTAKNTDNKEEHFYYNFWKFKNSEDSGEYFLWSSSTLAAKPDFVWVLGNAGDLSVLVPFTQEAYSAVRCVAN